MYIYIYNIYIYIYVCVHRIYTCMRRVHMRYVMRMCRQVTCYTNIFALFLSENPDIFFLQVFIHRNCSLLSARQEAPVAAERVRGSRERRPAEFEMGCCESEEVNKSSGNGSLASV